MEIPLNVCSTSIRFLEPRNVYNLKVSRLAYKVTDPDMFRYSASSSRPRLAAVLIYFSLVSVAMADVRVRTCATEPAITEIANGDLVNCEITPAGDSDVFRFFGQEGDRIQIVLMRYSGSAIQCFRVIESGGSIGSFCAATTPTQSGLRVSPSVSGELVLKSSGIHSLEVYERGANNSFTYGIHLQRLLPFPATTVPLPFGQLVSGEIAPRGDSDFFNFRGVGGDLLSVVVSRSAGNTRQCFRIMEPDGTILPLVCAATRPTPSGLRIDAAVSSNVRLTKTGAYLLMVSDGGDDSTFTYNLTVQCFGTCPTQPPPVSLTNWILPQLAFGGGWSSALYFANTAGQPVSFDVRFVGDDGKPMLVPSIGSSSKDLTLAPHGTAIIEAGGSGSLMQGYATVTLPATVAGYGVFRQSVPGRVDQEAVVPLARESSKSVLIWDETGFVTAVAIANPSVVDATVAVTLRDSLGAVIGQTSRLLAAGTKVTVPLRDFASQSAIAGKRGTAEFGVASGSIAALGLRFGEQAFTSIPTADR